MSSASVIIPRSDSLQHQRTFVVGNQIHTADTGASARALQITFSQPVMGSWIRLQPTLGADAFGNRGYMPEIKVLATVAVVGLFALLAACGGGGSDRPVLEPPAPTPELTPPALTSSDPEYHLETARFTTYQPYVLEQVGAHHAYARGLTGRGVRIGIDDTIVDYTQNAEFGSRVKLLDAEGASLAYSHPFGDLPGSDVSVCRQDPTCRIWKRNSEDYDEAHNNWVRDIVSQDGWPTEDDSAFVVDEYYSEEDPIESLSRWWEVPTPYGVFGSHGTVVASVAAGSNLGVAPEATIIPIAQNLSDDQIADAFADEALRLVIATLPDAGRRRLDSEIATAQRNEYGKFDIINRSYGTSFFDPGVISSSIDSELRWYVQYLPKTLDAVLQTDTPDAEKTILVYAAGNEGEPYSGLGADLPFYIPELRGHSLAVAATDPRTGIIADYSNLCGFLPLDWDATKHGPHYCLAAPGTVRGLVPNPDSPGRGDAEDGLEGTSFAAPMVSGALALLMEHFRGTRGNTEVVKRMLDTADRSGQYADLETYGAGHLDLKAALMPVGTLDAGQSARALSRTALQMPAAFGSVAARIANIELAAFDEQNFPFWIPMSALVSTQVARRSPIPNLENPTRASRSAGPNTIELHWMPANPGKLWLTDEREWVAGFAPTSASLARLPKNGSWGYGFSFSEGEYLDARASGGFGWGLGYGMIWTSRTLEHEFGNGWKLDATGTLAVSRPRYEKDAIFQASPSVFSALAMRVGTENTGITVEQPLRAESGVGTFRVENGEIENGRRLFDKYRIRLRPDAREVRITFRHERKALAGQIAIEAGGTMNANHTHGEDESRVGFAYRMHW